MLMAEAVMCFVIYLLVAFIMIGIGVSQLKSKTPVGFYTGEKPFAPEELSDVVMWNKRHGEMWMIYGGIILLSGLSGTFLIGADASWKLILVPMVGGVIVPIVWMMWYHGRLIRKYKIG